MKIKSMIYKLSKGKLGYLFYLMLNIIILLEYHYFLFVWKIKGCKLPDNESIELMKNNVTIIFKSFERQKMAKELYYNIQKYYPGIQVIIADDSKIPLSLDEPYLEIIHLPFNSGLSYGLNRALEKVNTPYVIRMDDDQLLTPYTRFHEQLIFLLQHSEIDLVGVLQYSAPKCESLDKEAQKFYCISMSNAPLPLLIPHLTIIDSNHVVVGKDSNVFIARTEKIKKIGYDDQIRMIDHHDFFYRAAGKIVSVLDPTAFVFHRHNIFDNHYQKYRQDVENDRLYIWRRNILMEKQKMGKFKNN